MRGDNRGECKRKRGFEMKKIFFAAALVLALASGALADSPHYLRADAIFTPNDACYSVSLKEAGLGNSGFSELTYTLTCDAAFTTVCVNRGNNQVQGVPKNGVGTASTSTILPIRNGQTNGTITLCPASFELPHPGCTGNQVELITAASYSECNLADGLGTASPNLPDLSGANLSVPVP
jgi:hypothetical protein